MVKRELLSLYPLFKGQDLSLAALRVLTGAFLIYGTWDNITSTERMDEFVVFLDQFGFVAPHLMAQLSVWVQFLCGLMLVLGLFTRWAGVLVCFNFIVAVVMVHWDQDFRNWWPAIVLVALGLHFAMAGGGRYALDRVVALDGSAEDD